MSRKMTGGLASSPGGVSFRNNRLEISNRFSIPHEYDVAIIYQMGFVRTPTTLYIRLLPSLRLMQGT